MVSLEILLKPEHEELRKWAKDFAAREVAPLAEDMDRNDHYPRELLRKMGEYGLLGINAPTEYGGLGLDLLSSVVVGEELAKVSLSAGLLIGVQNGLVGYPLAHFGTPEQKEKFLRHPPSVYGARGQEKPIRRDPRRAIGMAIQGTSNRKIHKRSEVLGKILAQRSERVAGASLCSRRGPSCP